MNHQRTVVWRGLDTFSTEHCSLWQADDGGWHFEGVILLTFGERPARVHYRVVCDAAWATRAVEVVLHEGERERVLRLSANDRQHWRVDGQERLDLNGCFDIDLGVTPATNTLPIRRFHLEPGASAPVTAAWVRFPDLTVEPLVQRYTRMAERAYRYETDSGFRADLMVDDLGLVQQYPDGWECVATTADASQ